MILYAVLVNPQPRCIQLRALHGLSIPILTHTQSLRQGPPAPGPRWGRARPHVPPPAKGRPQEGPPLPPFLPPCFPPSGVSWAEPAGPSSVGMPRERGTTPLSCHSSVGMPQECGECGTAPLSCGNAPGVWHSPPVLQPPRGCQGPPGHSGIGLGSHQLFTLLALVLVLSHMLGLVGFGFPVGFGWLGPGFSAPTFLRALSPPWPFRSVRGELERADLGKGNPAHVR